MGLRRLCLDDGAPQADTAEKATSDFPAIWELNPSLNHAV
jgi:hypothetical protein